MQYVFKEKIKKEEKGKGIVDNNPLAQYDHKCKRCGHSKAELISKGIWYSDEDEVLQFKCGKCGFVEMQEGKIG